MILLANVHDVNRYTNTDNSVLGASFSAELKRAHNGDVRQRACNQVALTALLILPC
jgi:hypothetical protein